MDILLAILAVLLLLVGLIGCVVPVVPGPPLSYGGLLLLQLTRFANFSPRLLFVLGAVTVAVTLLDFYLPVWFTKKYGGSRAASLGALMGVVAGLLFIPPLGIIVFPFLGAFLGQLLSDNRDHGRALRVAFGAVAAFMAGTGIKLIVSGVMLGYALAAFFS